MLPILATPKYDMIVPSTGKPITYRPYVVKEEKILLIAMESKDNNQIEKAVLDIIERCIESDIDLDKLTTFDIEYMFVTLRSKSVGEGIKINPSCEHCKTDNLVKIDIDKVTVSNLDKADVDLHYKLTDDISLDLKWQTMKDRNRIIESESETETIIQMIANSIDTVYSGEEIMTIGNTPKQEVIDFVESLNTDQFAGIVEILSKVPYLSYDVKFDCVKCEKGNTIGLSGLIDFFQ